MQAVKPSDPADPAQPLKLLEVELARQRALRLARKNSGGPRPLQIFSVLFLLALLAAGCFALWRLQAMRDERQPSARRFPPAAPGATHR